MYILFLLEEQKTSHSYANQAISEIKLLCNYTLNQGKTIEALPRQKKENKLLNVLSFEYAFIGDCIDSVKKILQPV